MKVITNKKKRVVTIRMDSAHMNELAQAIENFLKFYREYSIIIGVTIEDRKSVLRLLLDESLCDGPTHEEMLYRTSTPIIPIKKNDEVKK